MNQTPTSEVWLKPTQSSCIKKDFGSLHETSKKTSEVFKEPP